MKKIITPVEIQEKEFNKSFRGYDEEEVDMFLDLISLDLEKLIKENLNLKAQIATLKKEKSTIGDSNITVTETLETAKTLMDQLAESSEKRARILVENAELDAAKIVNDAKIQAKQIALESSDLIRIFENMKREYGDFLEVANRNFKVLQESRNSDKLNRLLKDDVADIPVTIEKIQKKNVEETGTAAVDDKVSENKSLEDKIREDAENSDADEKPTMVNIRYE